MLKKTLTFLALAIAALMLSSSAMAGTFTNGGFESGDLSGWTQGGGYWYGGWPLIPSNYLSNSSAANNTIMNMGTDPISGQTTVYNGAHSVRVNDSYNNDSVSVISQTVSNYTDPHIYFAWQAVLEGSHGLTDSDNFTLQLTDDTKGTTLYNVAYSSASAAGTSLFQNSATYGGWYFTPWQVQDLDVSAFAGDTFTLSLLASDCPYGGHAGYVYLDGFGAAPPPPVTGTPEPTSLWLIGSGLALAAKRFFRKSVA